MMHVNCVKEKIDFQRYGMTPTQFKINEIANKQVNLDFKADFTPMLKKARHRLSEMTREERKIIKKYSIQKIMQRDSNEIDSNFTNEMEEKRSGNDQLGLGATNLEMNKYKSSNLIVSQNQFSQFQDRNLKPYLSPYNLEMQMQDLTPNTVLQHHLPHINEVSPRDISSENSLCKEYDIFYRKQPEPDDRSQHSLPNVTQ